MRLLTPHDCNTLGFTLIELSIVLVIIGLLTGGVLVGRDLIHTTELRMTIAQQEKFNAATNTFKNKYQCLPGDCSSAGKYGFDVTPGREGNDNGRIGCNNTTSIGCGGLVTGDRDGPVESANFWYELSAAGLIEGSFPSFVAGGGDYVTAGIATPKTKISPRMPGFSWSGANNLSPMGWAVQYGVLFDDTGEKIDGHSFRFAEMNSASFAAGGGVFNTEGGGHFLPADIYYLDNKVDDGLPMSGSARAGSNNYINTGGVSPVLKFRAAQGDGSTPVCVLNNVDPPQYNIKNTDPGQNENIMGFGGGEYKGLCDWIVRASF